jgi:hypothetical protein
MKKNIQISVFLTVIFFFTVSCSKNDDTKKLSEIIIGKWTIAKIGFGPEASVVTSDYTDNEPGCNKDFWQFNSDGTFRSVNYKSLPSQCSEGVLNATYTISDKKLLISGSPSANIEMITESSLKIKVPTGATATVYEFAKQ